ncbi:MAG: peptidase [Lachnospiraceae bacterium]|nr:peptidase [Lachnospiraceae bacterium]
MNHDPSGQTTPAALPEIPAQTKAVIPKTPEQTEPAVPPKIPAQTGPAAASESSSQITLEEAKAVALSDAGLTDSDVTYLKTELDYDDQTLIYDIEFYTKTYEYDYEIHAHTGIIYHKEQDTYGQHAGHDTARDLNAPPFSSDKTSDGASGIDLETARAIAVSHADLLLSDVVFTKEKLDYDDGLSLYEFEFFYNGIEYEYEIDAATGTILEFNFEYP